MVYSDLPGASSDPRSARLPCPQCGDPLVRIQRRWIDRMLSLFTPVQRYRCRNHGCQWCGNMGARRTQQDGVRTDTSR